MNNKLQIGKIDGRESVQLDIPLLLRTRMLVQGSSGAGKSWLLRLLCEQVSGQIPFIIIDPEGEFASLRESVDAVLVGPEGEIPADISSAGLLCRKLIELRVSAIIDIYELKPEKRREYVKKFLDALMMLPKSLQHPTMIILDEAHKFAPERGGQKDVVSTQSVIDLMSLGRKRGFAGILATQRFTKIHNDAIAETLNVFIGRTSLSDDQDRAGKYLGIKGEERLQLRDMEGGDFYAFGPAFLVDGQPRGGVLRFKSDRVKTTHPEPGQEHLITTPKASDAIRQIVEHLTDLPQQAEEEARDVASLQKKVSRLERELTDAKSNASSTADSKELEARTRLLEARESSVIEAERALAATSEQVNSIAESAKTRISDAEKKEAELRAQLSGRIQLFTERLGVWKGELSELALAAELPKPEEPVPYSTMLNRMTVPDRPKLSIPAKPAARISPLIEIPKKATPVSHGEISEARSRLNGKQQKSIDVLLAFERLGRPEVERSIVGAFIDMSSTSGSFNTYLSGLKNGREGEFPPMIDYRPGSRLTLTEDGRNAAQTTIEINGLADLHDAWRNQIKIQKQRDVIDLLIGAYPDAISRRQIGETIGMSDSSGSFNTYMSALKSFGIVEYTKVFDHEAGKELPGLKATELLFPEGLNETSTA